MAETEKKKKTSDAQLKANAKHMEKLEDIKIRVVKGSEKDREYYKCEAKKRGKSLNEFALEAMDEKIEREPLEE